MKKRSRGSDSLFKCHHVYFKISSPQNESMKHSTKGRFQVSFCFLALWKGRGGHGSTHRVLSESEDAKDRKNSSLPCWRGDPHVKKRVVSLIQERYIPILKLKPILVSFSDEDNNSFEFMDFINIIVWKYLVVEEHRATSIHNSLEEFHSTHWIVVILH